MSENIVRPTDDLTALCDRLDNWPKFFPGEPRWFVADHDLRTLTAAARDRDRLAAELAGVKKEMAEFKAWAAMQCRDSCGWKGDTRLVLDALAARHRRRPGRPHDGGPA